MIREKIGKGQEEIAFEGNLSQLRQLLIKRYPELGPIIRVSRFAVNGSYVGDDYLLKGGEEIALIPPVSGG